MVHPPLSRPPSSLAESAYYSLDSSTPVSSNVPTPTQSPRLRPSDASQHTIDPSEHTITRIDMAEHTIAAPAPTTEPVEPTPPPPTSIEAAAPGPSKHDQDIEDPTPAPRYSTGGHPPMLDLKKKGSDAETKDSGVVFPLPRRLRALAFGMGPGTSGPAPPKEENAELYARAATAEGALSTSAVQKITAAELKDAKRVSKILKNEQKTEDRSMKAHIKELDKLSSVQRQAAKDEAAAIAAHRKAVKAEHKLNMKYLAAKAAWEKAAADLKSKLRCLTTPKSTHLRTQKATDDRERQAKLLALKNPSGRAATA
ncbi:hypothetical protein RhiLY_03123 [Ceratobasidium sp. AG-Ba]|nr:hypothetical protein RhiLY_03123 [Ceratobasidium sp. AG-Ba]